MLSQRAVQKILDPEPGSALAHARDYGIDLSLIAENVALTPDELLVKAEQSQELVRTVREIRDSAGRK